MYTCVININDYIVGCFFVGKAFQFDISVSQHSAVLSVMLEFVLLRQVLTDSIVSFVDFFHFTNISVNTS